MDAQKSRIAILARLLAILALLVPATTTALTVAVASPAHADVVAPAWWNGKICDTDNYPGSYPLGASYNGVITCGPGTYDQGGTDHLVRFYPNAWGEYEWECVELVMRYMDLVYGIAPYNSPGGKDVVDNYFGTVLTKVTNNGTITNPKVPSPGDIISVAGVPSTPGHYNNPNGHTVVVTGVNVVNGSGTITVMQQNNTANGWGTWAVTGGKVTQTVLGGAVTGWLHNSNGSGGGVSSSNSSITFTNGGGETYANANPISNPWTKLSNSTNAISASGGYTAFIDGCGAAWASSNFATVTATQLTPCNGAIAISIGAKGNVIFVDGCGSAHASATYTNSSSWVTLTGCGGTGGIAAGGGGAPSSAGVNGVINSCGALNVTQDFVNWTAITGCNGAGRVAIGPNGTLGFTNGCGALNASDNYTIPSHWVSITGCNGAPMFAVGTGKSLVFSDGCGSAHGTMTYDSSTSWVVLNSCGDTQAVTMGTNGETGVINGCGSLNVTADFQSWLNITPCSDAQKVAIG